MNGPGKRSCNRPAEWHSARMLLSCGLWMVFFPSSGARFAATLMTVSQGTLAALCILIAGTRCLVLWKNGDLGDAGPNLRAILSLLSIVVWAQFLIGLLPNMALGIPVYFWILHMEIKTCAAAARDLNGTTFRA